MFILEFTGEYKAKRCLLGCIPSGQDCITPFVQSGTVFTASQAKTIAASHKLRHTFILVGRSCQICIAAFNAVGFANLRELIRFCKATEYMHARKTTVQYIQPGLAVRRHPAGD